MPYEPNNYPQRRPMFRRTFNPSKVDKTAEIAKFAENKSKQIAKYTEDKEMSIVVTSSINNAVEWCVRHPDWQKDMDDDKRAEWLDDITRKFISFFAIGKADYAELYHSLKNAEIEKVEAIADKVLTDVETSVEELIPDEINFE